MLNLKRHVETFGKSLLFSCLLVLLMILPSCSQQEIEFYGSIVGVVTDAYTKEPIKGAQVTNVTMEQTCLTGSDGAYAFRDLKVMAENRYTVQVKADGYETDLKSIRIDTGDDNRLDFALETSMPILEIDETTVDFEKTYTTHTVTISNEGQADLNWEVNEDAEWLSCNPTSGTVRKGAKASLEIKVNRSGLKEGAYNTSLSISSNGGSKQVIVSMYVEGMSVTVSPSELDFGELTTTLPLILQSAKETKYYLETSNAWITASKVEGIFTGTEHLNITVDRTSLSAGKYEGSLMLRVGAAVKEIPVRMTKPSKQAPVVAFYSVSDISYSTAVLNGAVVSIGSSRIVRHGFYWSEDKNLPIEDWSVCNFGDCQKPGDIPPYEVSGLKPSAKYYVCAYAENSEGVSYSEVYEFTTQALPSAPTVETGTASRITHESAAFTGNILNIGYDTGIIEHGHVWSVSDSPTVNNFKTTLGKRDNSGAFSSELTGLAPNMIYHVRAYATNSIGTAYGEEKTFTTLPDEMLVSTASAERITHDSATLGGQITYSGGNVVSERGVCWAERKNPTIDDNSAVSIDQTDKFSVRIETLKPQTSYYYRAYVIAETGKVYYGNDVSFTTTHEMFLPETSEVSIISVDTNSAKVSSSLVDDGKGNVSDLGFVYSDSANPTVDDYVCSCGVQQGAFSATLNGLLPNTLYYVRSYAVNEVGTSYGEVVTFQTKEAPQIPTVKTGAVLEVKHNSAVVSGELVKSGVDEGVVEYGHVWSLDNEPDIYDYKANKGVSTATGQYSSELTGLSPNVTYYVRAYATNKLGTSYGDVVCFCTKDILLPEVSDVEVVSCSHRSARFSAQVLTLNYGTMLAAGFVYSTSSEPDLNDNVVRCDASGLQLAGKAVSLEPLTEYYVKAFVTNEKGTVYSGQVKFITKDKSDGSDFDLGDFDDEDSDWN